MTYQEKLKQALERVRIEQKPHQDNEQWLDGGRGISKYAKAVVVYLNQIMEKVKKLND